MRTCLWVIPAAARADEFEGIGSGWQMSVLSIISSPVTVGAYLGCGTSTRARLLSTLDARADTRGSRASVRSRGSAGRVFIGGLELKRITALSAQGTNHCSSIPRTRLRRGGGPPGWSAGTSPSCGGGRGRKRGLDRCQTHARGARGAEISKLDMQIDGAGCRDRAPPDLVVQVRLRSGPLVRGRKTSILRFQAEDD